MTRWKPDSSAVKRVGSLLLAGAAAAVSMTLFAQNDASSLSGPTVVELAYSGKPPTGPYSVVIWNSGLFEPDEALYNAINGSVIIVTGGESDIAYANGKRDFEDLPAHVPVFHGVYPSVGHGGTCNQDNGGPFGVAAVAWLKWQLLGDTGASGRGYFIGDDCGICQDPNWLTDWRSLR
jgi:hypothetical protein